MISQLEELVYGAHNFEKVKLEERYLQISVLVEHIYPQNIKEFEIMEKCLYKIKEQLRVKSSNLNTIIKKNNKLSLSTVQHIISVLESRRFEILQLAFSKNPKSPKHSSILNTNSNINQIEDESEDSTVLSQYTTEQQSHNSSSKINNNFGEVNHNLQNKISTNEISTNNKLNNYNENKNITEEDFSLSTIGQVCINTKSFENLFSRTKKILTLLFDTQYYVATMLYIPSIFTNTSPAQMIGISQHSQINNPLLMSRNPQFAKEINAIHNAIISHKQQSSHASINNQTIKEEKSKEDYVVLERAVPQMQTLREDEDTLESLIQSNPSTHTQYFNAKNFQYDDQTITLTTGNDIEFEKKEVAKEEKANIEDNIQPYSDTTNNSSSKEEAVQGILPKNALYSDENVEVSLTSNPNQMGQMELTLKDTPSLSQASQSVLIHSILSAKIFLETIFQTFDAQGTMLVESLNSSKIHLLPRYSDDTIFLFNGQSKSDEVLTQIQQKIHARMMQELKSEQNNKQSQTIYKEETVETNNSSSSSQNSTKDKRARYLLSSLRRLG
ncbi:MAG: hypothetical protein ACLFPL_04460 [Candidatus Nanoarchaeia archaeon]